MDDDPDGIGLLPAEVAGEVIGPVAHLSCHIGDTLAGLYIDSGVVFQTPADRGGGEVEHFGNIVDGDVFFGVHAGVRADFGTNMKLFSPKKDFHNIYCNRLQDVSIFTAYLNGPQAR
jgi:hypothetical protein